MPEEPSAETPQSRRRWRDYVHRTGIAVLIVALFGGLIVLLWVAYEVALLFFASVLLAILLRTLTLWVSRFTRLGRGWSLGIVILGLFAIAAGIGWLLAAPISREINQLSEELPKAVARLQAQIEQFAFGKTLVEKLRQPTSLLSQAGGMLAKAKDVFSITVEGIIYVWVVLFCGLFLAAEPQFYLEGFLKLLPIDKRPRGRVLLLRLGNGLRSWLFGQIISMTIIGILTWLGLHLLGVPLSAALGLVAGVLDFVPVAGPWIAGVLSCTLALLRSPMHAVYVAALFVALHLFEGHVLIPLVQKEAARLPPVLTVLAMVLFAKLFGFLGLFLATPLLALVLITTQTLYVEDVLEERGRGTGDE